MTFKFTEDININKIGSYLEEDVTFLLKDISDISLEQNNAEREEAIQSGIHYSEMLPVEYKPTDDYIELFHKSLDLFDKKIAKSVALVSERIYKEYKEKVILVSLARAGTPAAILIRRYLKFKYGLNLKHYSVSIIRGKGIDENSIKYILHHHPNMNLQFIDGWTGKGAITKELSKALINFNNKYKTELANNLAVIADPGYCVEYFGTREDFLIPSACLNSTVSGLVSRTVHRKDLVDENEFHGAKYYKELETDDFSQYFIDRICSCFQLIDKIKGKEIEELESISETTWTGMKDVDTIMDYYKITNVHFVKPGIGETTRVLLRRIPWKVLLSENVSEDDPDIKHIVQLAVEKSITIERFPMKAYKCCGIIKEVR